MTSPLATSVMPKMAKVYLAESHASAEVIAG